MSKETVFYAPGDDNLFLVDMKTLHPWGINFKSHRWTIWHDGSAAWSTCWFWSERVGML